MFLFLFIRLQEKIHRYRSTCAVCLNFFVCFFADPNSLSKESADGLKDWLKGALLDKVHKIKVQVHALAQIFFS